MSKQTDAAYRKGYEAAREGKTLGACPYIDHRTGMNRITFSRTFIRAWQYGWQDFHKGLPIPEKKQGKKGQVR